MALIYRAELPDGRNYIGSTKRAFQTRVNEHRHYYKVKKYQMYKNIDCDFDEIKWSVLEECEDVKIWERENYYIKKYDSISSGLNSAWASQGALGMKHSRETIQKREKTKMDNMPFFKVAHVKDPEYYLTTNSYDRAADFTGQSRDSVRKKLRNGRNCTRFTYKYIS